MAVAEKYDFEVVEKKLIVEGTNVVIPDRKVIMRKDNSKILSIMSDKYHIATHKDIIQRFEEALDASGPSFKKRKVTTALPYNGAKMFRKYTFESIVQEIEVGDIINPTVELWNSYDGTIMVGFQVGAWRKACTNGLMVPVTFKEIMKKHYAGFDIGDLVKELTHILPVFEDSLRLWKEWRGIPVQVEDIEALLKPAGMTKKDTAKVVERFKDHEEKTKWGFFQAVTWVISHEDRGKKKKNGDLTRLWQVNQEANLAGKVFYPQMLNK